MKKNQRQDQKNRDAEILKAVAQAWHSRSSSGSSRAASEETSEYDTLRRRSTGTPSRFRIEAARAKSTTEDGNGRRWDFGQSLWDSYEILSVSRKLETGLVMEGPFDDAGQAGRRRRRESSRSLRSLFNRMSSRRFSEEEEEE